MPWWKPERIFRNPGNTSWHEARTCVLCHVWRRSGQKSALQVSNALRQQWGKCLQTEIVALHFATSEWSKPPYVRLRSSLAPGSRQRWQIFRQEIIFNFLLVKAASVEKVPERNKKMTNTNRTPSRWLRRNREVFHIWNDGQIKLKAAPKMWARDRNVTV